MAASPSSLPPIAITGASGFVGRRLVQLARAHAADRTVVLLVRDPAALSELQPLPGTWRVVRADLAAGTIAPGAIPPGAVVVHLAAATGRLAPAVMRAVNVEGTRTLLEASRAAGASHMVFVSSIAAAFADRRWYPYAEAKREGEAMVRASGIPFTIVRPTMVLGDGSPVQEGLERLALGAAPIVLGSGRVQLQPVHVDDLAAFLLALALAPEPAAEAVEVGGATRASMRQVLAAMRAAHGRPARRVVGVPLAPIRRMLALAESLLGGRLPVTAGQMASFVNDSVATPHRLAAKYLPSPRTPDVMRSAVAPLPDRPAEGAPRGGQHAPMAPTAQSADTMQVMAAEFARFARYLGTPVPPSASAAAYVRAAPGAGAPTDRLDRWLLALARSSAPGCTLADAYARLARPYGQVRRRLILTLAVLESSTATHSAYDAAITSGAPVAWAAMGIAGIRWVLRTAAALVLLGPLHLAAAMLGEGGGARG
jgi:nucleoside-diphosphate-sugar epimerase